MTNVLKDSSGRELISQKEFTNFFALPYLGYENPREFIDENFGFSALKSYSNGYGSLLRIFITGKDIQARTYPFPLGVSISYGKKTDGGLSIPTEEIPSNPISLECRDEFYYEPTKREFLSKRGFLKKLRQISPREIMEVIDNKHRKPTKKFLGLWLRVRIVFWHKLMKSFWEGISYLLGRVLYIMSGIKMTKDPWIRIIWPERITTEAEEKKKTSFTKEKTTNLFGYEAPVWAIMFYCCLHLVLYIMFFLYNYKPTLVTTIFKSAFLTVIYVVVSLKLVDTVLPWMLKGMIRGTDKLFYSAASHKIKI
ncbi:MAG: hypothetical protein WCF77_04305 [Minisyncoccia bacterium]